VLVGWVGLEPTTGGLREVRPGAPEALPAQMARSRATDDANCADCTGDSAYEPVHVSTAITGFQLQNATTDRA
jgi:hypothetical protein